jgi:hypothetical protein
MAGDNDDNGEDFERYFLSKLEEMCTVKRNVDSLRKPGTGVGEG